GGRGRDLRATPAGLPRGANGGDACSHAPQAPRYRGGAARKPAWRPASKGGPACRLHPVGRRKIESLDARVACRLGEGGFDLLEEATMRQGRLSLAGLSVLFALGLALWEVYFFWFAGSFPSVNGMLGLFTAERLGFNMAW